MTVLSRRRFLQGLGVTGAALFAHPLDRALTGTAWADVPPTVPRGVHLSFVGDASTTLTAMWFTNGAATTDSVLEWATIGEGDDPEAAVLARRATGTTMPTPGVDALAHTVTIEGLEPGGRIAYRVGSDAGWSPVRATRTVPDGDPFRMVVFGDHGTGATSRRTTLACLAVEPALALVAGDISYANGKQEVWDTYFDEVEPLSSRVPTLTAMGNHDNEDPADGGFGYDTYRARFAQPGDELHYSFDAGRVHVLVLEAGEAVSDPQQLAGELEFAERDLATAAVRRELGEIDFILVLQHFPIWSNHATRGNDATLIAAQEPLFVRYGVDLLLVGHNHMYERSLPMINGEPTTTERSEYGADRRGYIEVITGGAGKGLYDFVPPEEIQPWSAVYARRFHFTQIDVAEGALRVQAFATDTADGSLELLDDFRLLGRRSVAPVAVVPEAPSAVLPLVAAGAAGAALLAAHRHGAPGKVEVDA